MPNPAKSALLQLAKARAAWVTAVVHAVVAVALLFFPLTNGLGFERALATALVTAVTAPTMAVVATRLGVARGESLRWWASALALSLLSLLPSYAAGLLYETATLPCDRKTGSLFFLLLGGGNALVGTSLGYAAAHLTRRYDRWVTATLLILIYLGWLSVALLRLYREPQIFLFVTPFGFWPGSLYDEALGVGPALIGFRAQSLLFALALTSFTQAGIAVSVRGRGWGQLFNGWMGAGVALASLALWVRANGAELGFLQDRGTLRAELGRTLTTPHFILHAAPTVDAEALEALAHEHELALTQLRRFFGPPPQGLKPGPIRSFVYRDPAQKGRLMGASRTQVARPWVREIHIHGAQVPHAVLRHELAHILAGEHAPPPFNVPLGPMLVPNIGLIEGLAVAADWPARELTVHQWAAAMLKLGNLPEIAQILEPWGFWGISSARAYTAAGSFVRWLFETEGIAKVSRIYSGESMSTVYGRGVVDLERSWREALEEVRLSPGMLRRAEHRFARPSIFEKTCARTSAKVAEAGYGRLRAGDRDGARRALGRLYRFQPSDPTPLIALGEAYMRVGQLAEAEALAQRAQDAPGATEQARARALELQGQIAWKRGDRAGATAAFERVRGLDLSRASRRLQTVRLELLKDPAHPPDTLRAYLSGELGPIRAMLKLGDLATTATTGQDWRLLARYLYARRLQSVGAPEEALAMLPAPESLPSEGLKNEARMMRGQLAYGARRFPEAARWFDEAAQRTEDAVVRALAEDWSERARQAIERNRQSTALRSDG